MGDLELLAAVVEAQDKMVLRALILAKHGAGRHLEPEEAAFLRSDSVEQQAADELLLRRWAASQGYEFRELDCVRFRDGVARLHEAVARTPSLESH